MRRTILILLAMSFSVAPASLCGVGGLSGKSRQFSVPEGRGECSPALQCWGRYKNRPSPGGTAEKHLEPAGHRKFAVRVGWHPDPKAPENTPRQGAMILKTAEQQLTVQVRVSEARAAAPAEAGAASAAQR